MAAFFLVQSATIAAPVTTQTNGTAWFDTTNNRILASGGGFLQVGSTYYWYGQASNAQQFVHLPCYSSTDLKNWKFESYVLTSSSDPSLNSCKIERPKVIYNAATAKYVLWAHYENAVDYSLAEVIVATSSSPTGPFTVVNGGPFKPNGQDSRDMTVYNDNGTAYLITATTGNADLGLFQLTADFTGIASQLPNIFTGAFVEAPGVVKVNGVYFLLTSFQAGWYPNQQQYSTASSITGTWTPLQPIGNNSGFYSQTTYILPITAGATTSYLFLADRNNPLSLQNMTYVWLPLTFSGTTASMDYYDSDSVDTAAGTVTGVTSGSLLSLNALATASSVAAGSSASNANDGNYGTRWLASSSTYPQWWEVDLGSTSTISNVQCSWPLVKGSEAYFGYQIQTSSDNVNWTVALDRSTNTNFGFTSDQLSASARYVRVNIVSQGNTGLTYTPQLWEVKVYGTGGPPPSPPPTPTGLAATPGNAQVSLSWNPASFATSYNVKRATVSGGPYTTIASPTANSYSDTAVVNGTTYYYVVSAVNSLGESANSAQVSATPSVPLSLNQPVTASSFQTGNDPFHGNDGNLATRWTAFDGTYPQWWRVDLGSSKSINQAVINWYNTDGRVYGYKIETSPDDVTYTLLVDKTGNTVAGTTSDTFSATARYVRITVTGVSIAGKFAAFWECSIYGATTPPPPPPPAPTGLTATAASSSQINLSWTASSGATSYNVKRATVSGGPYTTIATGVTATTFSDTGLAVSTTYFYVVSAVNAGGESANSAQASATTQALPPPPAPTGLSATPGNAQVALSWTASSGATSYNVKRATVNGGPYTTIASPTTTSYTDTTVTNGTTYYYVVSAVNSSGESANSAQVSATPSAPTIPAAPAGLTATVPSGRGGRINLSWTASSGATSYNVKQATVSGGPYATIAAGVTATTYNNSGLTSGTTYYYVVSAVNAAGESPNSNQASATAK